MTNVSGWISFRQIVDDIMMAQGDHADYGQFMRYLNFAVRGYEELRLHSLPATKPVTLPIDGEMRIVVLPDDFLKFVSVGVMSSEKFYPFKPKSDMVLKTTADCGVDTRTTAEELPEVWYYTGYYSLDPENRRILIEAPLSVTEVVLNYTPTGVRLDGKTYIPRMCRGVIEAYVEYQAALRDKNVTAFDKQMFANEYLKELNKFRGLQYNSDELFNAYYDFIKNGKPY